MPDFESIKNNLSSLFSDAQDYWQWLTILLCLLGAIAVSIFLNRTILAKHTTCSKVCTRFFGLGKSVSRIPSLTALLLWITWVTRCNWSDNLILNGHDPIASDFIHTAALLISAFVIYQVAAALSKGQSVPRFLGFCLLLLFTLHLFGWLKPLSQALQSISISIGTIHINLWSIMAAIAAMILLFWLVGLSTRFLDAVITPRSDIPPSIKVLIGKASRIILYIGALGWALKIGGVPLGGLTVFSGALGLGLGFGLQKVISNLMSGVIILLDKSIKPGDVIEIDGTLGWINSIRTRYTSVITRDRKEILIPNEDFVTNKVVNWSFTDRTVRIKADVGVAYATDIPVAIEICKQAITGIPRVLSDPPPNCLLMGFGESSIDLQVRFWIDDAPQGVSNVRSEVLLAIWQAFKDNGIKIPFPQRDLHIKSDSSSVLSQH